jgi:type II secretory pathway pseudopilin PulG
MAGSQPPKIDRGPWMHRLWGQLRAFTLVEWCVIAVIVAVLVALILPAIGAYREARYKRPPQCSSLLRRIALALQNYHSEYGSFPPAYLADEQGRPMHSWRVMILPYLEGEEAQKVAQQYRWDEPWDSPHNLLLTQAYMPGAYGCPMDRDRSEVQTNYVAITGRGTAWDGGNSIREKDVVDGLANSLAIGDLSGLAVHWSEPRDVNMDELIGIMRASEQEDGPRPSHQGGTNFLLLDASVHFIQRGVPPETLRAMSTIAGGEKFEPPF